MSHKLVWSDDPRDKKRIDEDASEGKFKEDSQEFVDKGEWHAVFRIEKNGRGGKTVSVLQGLPKQDKFLKDLCKELKNRCASGGSYSAEHGQLEIQGDQREKIKAVLIKRGIKFKGL